MMSVGLWLTCAALFVALAALLLSVFLLSGQRQLRLQIRELESKEKEPSRESFDARLVVAEEEYHRQLATGAGTAEKYRLVEVLSSQGRSNGEIAEQLRMSDSEVAQLLSLVRLKQNHNQAGH